MVGFVLGQQLWLLLNFFFPFPSTNSRKGISKLYSHLTNNLKAIAFAVQMVTTLLSPFMCQNNSFCFSENEYLSSAINMQLARATRKLLTLYCLGDLPTSQHS